MTRKNTITSDYWSEVTCKLWATVSTTVYDSERLGFYYHFTVNILYSATIGGE